MSKYKVGDNVVIRKDLEDWERYGGFGWIKNSMEFLAEMPYVKIDSIHNCQNGTAYAVYFNNFFISDQMIAGLYEEDETKYLWVSDEFEREGLKYISIIAQNQEAYPIKPDSNSYKEILKGKHDKFLMTELEAKEHHLFKIMNRIEVQKEDVQKEELYFIRPFDCEQQHLIELGGGYLFVGDKYHYVNSEARKHFTKEECNKIIGTSTILHKILVK